MTDHKPATEHDLRHDVINISNNFAELLKFFLLDFKFLNEIFFIYSHSFIKADLVK